jgi:hypothetical protein
MKDLWISNKWLLHIAFLQVPQQQSMIPQAVLRSNGGNGFQKHSKKGRFVGGRLRIDKFFYLSPSKFYGVDLGRVRRLESVVNATVEKIACILAGVRTGVVENEVGVLELMVAL